VIPKPALRRASRTRRPADRGAQHGVFASGPVGLGHARLGIADIGSCGHQPMRSADGAPQGAALG
jgi:asparagine synthetase B (glutamine-hydrolysing)